jgi:hypothetical protein
MMKTKKIYQLAAVPAIALGLGAPMFLAGGCGEAGLDCAADVQAKVKAFQGAVDALVAVSAEMKAAIAVSCAKIATDLGATDVPDVSKPETLTDDDLQKACDAATLKLDAELQAGAEISLEIVGGECHVNASAQLSCEASCSVEGGCDPGSIDIRCEPGELSGSCEAECQGSCTVTSGSVSCEGGCSGTCQGDCSGECATTDGGGKCAGKCEGTCKGECTGTCEVVPPSAKCEGSCKGGCSIAYKAPQCEGELKPPSCDINAECKGGCNAQGQLDAECTPPKIKVTVTGGANGNLAATLEANLPEIFLAFKVQGGLFLDAAAYVAETAVDVAGAVITIPACVLVFGADLATKFGASVEASVSVSVSVEASASVGGKAGA